MPPVAVIFAVISIAIVAIGLLAFRRSAGTVSTAGSSESSVHSYSHRFGLEDLARRLEVSVGDLQSHSPSYRTVHISKSGGRHRILEIPDAATMLLQRRILRRLLNALRSHPMACGFEKYASIVDAALPHQGKRVVVKMDIRRFFESTTADRVQAWFEQIGWRPEAAALLVKLTTSSGHLPQGAPTSPRLSNLVNSPMDEGLSCLAQQYKGSYSRYADDITISFDLTRGRRVRGVIQVARRILRSYGYTMHGGRKLKVLRRHQQQSVLGLVVNSKVALPRKTRRWLRAVRHNRSVGKPISLSDQQLNGWEAFALMVEKQRCE